MAEEESGLDELMRLSQQFTRQEEERQQKERQREEQGKKVQGVLKGLKDLQVNMAVEQLKAVASPKTIAGVEALRSKAGTEDLRDMITAIADEMERRLGAMASADPENEPLANSMRTLSILMDLYFSLH